MSLAALPTARARTPSLATPNTLLLCMDTSGCPLATAANTLRAATPVSLADGASATVSDVDPPGGAALPALCCDRWSDACLPEPARFARSTMARSNQASGGRGNKINKLKGKTIFTACHSSLHFTLWQRVRTASFSPPRWLAWWR